MLQLHQIIHIVVHINIISIKDISFHILSGKIPKSKMAATFTCTWISFSVCSKNVSKCHSFTMALNHWNIFQLISLSLKPNDVNIICRVKYGTAINLKRWIVIFNQITYFMNSDVEQTHIFIQILNCKFTLYVKGSNYKLRAYVSNSRGDAKQSHSSCKHMYQACSLFLLWHTNMNIIVHYLLQFSCNISFIS